MRSISLLYTTARPQVISKVIERWFAEDPQEIDMIVVTDDPFHGDVAHPSVRFVVNSGRRDAVTGWNLAAQLSAGDILIQVSDDLFPPLKWAETIRSMIDQLVEIRSDVVLNLLDERRDQRAVFHPILTRAAFDKLSYLYPPDFESMFSDNWFCAYHKKYSCYACSNEIFWHHRHRTTHEVEIDDVMLAHESPERFEKGKETFKKYIREHDL